MTDLELRDADEARRFLLQGAWLQRTAAPSPATLRLALEWALEVTSGGQALPPLGFVADLGLVALGLDQGQRGVRDSVGTLGLPPGLARTYEDHVLGKLYADWRFERASDAVRRLAPGRDQARGVAFLLNQLRERAPYPGVHLSPAVIRGLLELPAEESLHRGWETLTQEGLLPVLPTLYEGLIAAARRCAEVLGTEDVFELEHGTALLDFGQRVALRQVLQAAAQLEAALPLERVPARSGRQQVHTRMLDEDTYPVGGYSSLSTRGSIESLLHSQLAYMETDERPDLFDIKYLRDELLYYARDENQFLRQRRTFVIALLPDLVQARFKDAALPWQRIVLLLGLVTAIVRKLSDWLSTDSLAFEILFVDEDQETALGHEQALLAMVLATWVANGSVRVERCASLERLSDQCARQARRSLCHCLLATSRQRLEFRAEDTVINQLVLAEACPELSSAGEQEEPPAADQTLGGWAAVLERLLRLWV